MPNYDYIIIGAGAAGLMLADTILSDSFFQKKSILILDKSLKKINDRTWCFWGNEIEQFEDIIYKSWQKIKFSGKEIDINPNIAPYTYKMVRGIDFYNHFLGKFGGADRVELIEDTVSDITEKEVLVEVQGHHGLYVGKQIFDSRFDYQQLKSPSKYPLLQQHFLGWFIKVDKPVFDVETATFMDFSIPQNGHTRFMYVLPFSETEALVEYTLFSEKVLEQHQYEEGIKKYLKESLGVENYAITDIEKGNIPMTCFDFSKENTNRVLKIGIAGGWAKASTGYTFYNSSKKTKKLVQYLKTNRPMAKFSKKNRFWFYDLLLLDILHASNHLGSEIFESLFKRRKPQLILKFLDEETSLLEEVLIVAAPKPGPFIKALVKRIF